MIEDLQIQSLLESITHCFINFSTSLQVMLTALGLAKEIDGSRRSISMWGTTEYMAPEI